MACKPRFSKLVLVLVTSCGLGLCSDWVTARGDAQRTGCQLNEKSLSLNSVKGLRLLWNKHLGTNTGLSTDPLILGPCITHRGVKELVLAKNSADILYAIDADLGTIFWTRALRGDGDEGESHTSCTDPRVTPAMSTPPVAVRSKAIDADDDFSDGNRPIYVISTDASLYAIRPSNGEDFYSPLQFIPAGAGPSDLKVIDSVVSVSSSKSCGSGPQRDWIIRPNTDKRSLVATVRIGKAEKDRDEQFASTSFRWKGEQVLATLTPGNRLALLDAFSGHLLGRTEISSSGSVLGLATAANDIGKRCLYVTSSNSVAAYAVTAGSPELTVKSIWKTTGLILISAPVVANGLVYALVAARGLSPQSAQLQVFNAHNGMLLYTSDPVSADRLHVTNLALANGHVVFGTGDGVLHCFGFPVDL